MSPRWRVAIVGSTDAPPAWLIEWRLADDFDWIQVSPGTPIPTAADLVLTQTIRARPADSPEATDQLVWELSPAVEPPFRSHSDFPNGDYVAHRVMLPDNLAGSSVVTIARLAGDYAALAREAAKLQIEAHRDPLTGLLGRRGWASFVERCTQPNSPPLSIAIAILDLDRFKSINEAEGLAAGDQILRLVAHQLQAIVKPDEQLARWGGDEFILAVPITKPSEAYRRINEVRQVCNQPPSPVTASVGWAFAQIHSHEDFKKLFRQADEGLRLAKLAGGNCCKPGNCHEKRENTEFTPQSDR
ncbi:MAG: GGDEF domain-containing protein [Pirellulales bacterium]